jgi:xylitol oxidase
VAGSVVTATHGSGVRQRSLASAVAAVELVSADGQCHTYSRDKDPELFPGVVVNLGALGVLTRLTLDLVRVFDVRQDVFDDLPWEAVFEHFDEIQAAGYSVSLFTDWAHDAVDQVWLKNRVEPDHPYQAPGDFHGAVPADGPRHPVHAAGMPVENCTEQLGRPGPWYDRLPHFRLEFTPSAGNELQSEYFVPRQHALPAFEALRGLGERLAPMLLISEIRTVAADDLWLSPFYGGDRVALHFTWRGFQREVEALLPAIEERLEPFGVRPHWGKLFHRGSLASCYPRMPEFRALAERLDPDGKFRSPFVRRHVFAAPAA